MAGGAEQPSLFPMGGGSLGLMGEAGAEAILPLRRGADGALGVAMTGGENAFAPIIFNVTATDAARASARAKGRFPPCWPAASRAAGAGFEEQHL